MQIEHPNNSSIVSQSKRTPFYELFEADEDLIQELVDLINSLFSPLSWVLQETLYKRIQKQDKGWIEIEFLNRNTEMKSIFKKYAIPPHCRRKSNLLKKAIDKSIIKKKRNLIKRRDHININAQLKKVIYFQARNIESIINKINAQLIEQQSVQQKTLHLMTKNNLTKMIESKVKEMLKKKDLGNDQMEIESTDQMTRQVNESIEGVQFLGSIFKCQSPQKSPNMENESINQIEKAFDEKKQIEQSYRWCFVYLPNLHAQTVQKIIDSLKMPVLTVKCFEDSELQDKMNNLNLLQTNPNIFPHINSNIKVFSLIQLIQKYYPAFQQICTIIGYSQVNLREQRLRQNQKQRQKQKVRLFESRYLDKKIDLVNQYHVKLELEKQRKGYFQKKQLLFDKRRRQRQQKRRNRQGKQQSKIQRKDMTSKLKQLLNMNEPKNQTKQQIIGSPEQIHQPNVDKNLIQEVQNDIQVKSCGMVIKLPKYSGDHEREDYPKASQIRAGNQSIEELYEEDQEELISSSKQQFVLSKQKNSKNKNNKHKKISKLTDFKQQKRQSHKSESYSLRRQTQGNKTAEKSTQIKNQPASQSSSVYNLRHKSPIQGSYLKMAGFSQLNQKIGSIDRSKSERQQMKSSSFVNEKEDNGRSRNTRSSRKHFDKYE